MIFNKSNIPTIFIKQSTDLVVIVFDRKITLTFGVFLISKLTKLLINSTLVPILD
jgi:hypothetical protein